MKCDELKRYTLDFDYENNVVSIQNDDGGYMDAYEVDEAIAELKAALKESEEARYEAGADAADYYQENRRLKRALWLARAERAKEFRYKIGFAISSMNTKYDYSDADKWENVERKCRAKAEEYR